MVNLVKAILSTEKSDRKQMKRLKKQLRANEGDINKESANMAPIHAAVFTDNTEIVQQIVRMKGVNVDAVFKKDENRESLGVLDVALTRPHPSIEIIQILLEFVNNPVLSAKSRVPACIFTAIDHEYFEILELFHGKGFLFGAIDGTMIFKLVSFAVLLDKPCVLRWLLQLPEVISYYMDEGEEVERRRQKLIAFLLEDARNHDRVVICELLTEFMGKSLGELDGDGMHLKDSVVPASACGNPKDDLKETKSTGTNDVLAVKIKYCWNCENPSRYMCVGCRKARYCESSCQWDDWDSHKEYCLVQMNKIAFKEFKYISPSIFQ